MRPSPRTGRSPTSESIGVTYRGRDRAFPLENYARAFPDMHRELHQVYVSGDIVVVQLALQGTHNGPLSMAGGTLEPTGNRMDPLPVGRPPGQATMITRPSAVS